MKPWLMDGSRFADDNRLVTTPRNQQDPVQRIKPILTLAGQPTLLNSPLQAGGSSVPVGRGATTSHVFFTFLLCIVITALPVATHFVSPGLAIACQFLLVTGCVLYLTPLAPLVVVFSLLFQNLFVSLFSSFLTGQDDYNFVRGYNFLTMMITWIWLFGHYAIHWREQSRSLNRLMLFGIIGFVFIGIYLLLGMAKNPAGAVIYLRNVITPLVMFQIFLLTSNRTYQPILPFFIVTTVLVTVLVIGWAMSKCWIGCFGWI